MHKLPLHTELIVVYFDQHLGAAHSKRWSKYEWASICVCIRWANRLLFGSGRYKQFINHSGGQFEHFVCTEILRHLARGIKNWNKKMEYNVMLCYVMCWLTLEVLLNNI